MTIYHTVDLHSHTLWSKDCLMEFKTILRICERRQIDRLAITDHNTADGALRLKGMAPERIIVGEEIMTSQGEILAYFVQESVPPGLTPLETIRRLRDQGAVISVSHPFDRLRKGAWEEAQLRAIVDRLDAIEVFNARCLFAEDNQRAAAFAQEVGLPGTAGSDAHSHSEYGQGRLRLPAFETPVEFLAALRQAEVIGRRSLPHVHGYSTLAKWAKKAKVKPRMWDGG